MKEDAEVPTDLMGMSEKIVFTSVTMLGKSGTDLSCLLDRTAVSSHSPREHGARLPGSCCVSLEYTGYFNQVLFL